MIHHDSDLFYDIYNNINKHNQRQTHCLPMILPTYFDFFFFLSDSKSSSITYICFIIHHDFYVVTFHIVHHYHL